MPENSTYKSNTKRIAKNTLMLYFRQILIMLVSLYTVRVVLSVLGATDYGIYNVVAGVVTMFSFLSGAMATASQRFFSFAMGKGDSAGLKKTFSVTLSIYVVLFIAIFILAETVGLWFVSYHLVIPPERMTAAFWIYQAAVVSFMFTLITTPYMAAIIAHENMNVYAYVSIVEAVLKLAVVFALMIIPQDKLIVYGALMLFVAMVNTTLYRLYCRKHYEECKFKLVWDKGMFKEIFSYSGWNLFGASVGIFKNQLVNILLNQFYGPVVNAARAVSLQVSNAVTSFSQSFCSAMNPQIVKTYAAENKKDCMDLVFKGSKFTFYLLFIFALPLILEMHYVLSLWLKNLPDFAVLFTILTLVDVLVDSMSRTIIMLAQATGKIKLYQSVVGGILRLNLPVSYIALKLGAEAYCVLIIAIAMTLISSIVRVFILRRLTEFSILDFIKKAIIPIILVTLFASILPYFAREHFDEGFLRLCITSLISVISTSCFVLLFGVTKLERKNILAKIKKVFHHA